MCLNFFTAGATIYRITKWQLFMAGQLHPELVEQHPHNESWNVRPPEFLKEDGCCGAWTDTKIAPADRLQNMKKYFTEYVKCVAKADGKRITSDISATDSIDENDSVDLDNFDFSRYLALVLDDQLSELINFGTATWLIIIVVFALHMLLVATVTGSLYISEERRP